MSVPDAFATMMDEKRRAEENYGPFTSTHEAYGVLAEEVAELLDAIRTNRLPLIGQEAAQVAAVALRLAEQCLDSKAEQFANRSRGVW